MPPLANGALLSRADTPAIVTTCRTPAVFRAISVTRSSTFCVRSSAAPSGNYPSREPRQEGRRQNYGHLAALGFTVNLSTLFAIVLAIGIVVDDAIVVVEGAAHNIEQGMNGHDAAIRAMDQLFGPIIGITSWSESRSADADRTTRSSAVRPFFVAAKAPMMVTGTVRAPVLQEYQNDDEDEDRRLVKCLVHMVVIGAVALYRLPVAQYPTWYLRQSRSRRAIPAPAPAP
jgi:hypothetical protein